MPTRDPRIILARIRSLEGGVDSGHEPNLLPVNTSAFAINTTFRGGWPTCRPGLKKCTLDFGGVEGAESAFKSALFQCAGGYNADDGGGSIIPMIGGRQWRITLDRGNDFDAKEITIAGDPNPHNRQRAWWTQAENYFLIQDGLSKCFIYNGGSARRAGPDEIPVGNPMTYYMGRIWVARGREYLGGDIVFGPSGTSANGLRDSVLKFTEAKYLNEGGAFGVPVQAGEITGFKPIASINTALGQGELIVATRNKAFAAIIPQDRATWKNTTQLLQRVIKLSSAAYAQDSLVNVNEDLFYRSRDGVNSIIYSVRNSGQWGNRVLSNEMRRIFSRDSEEFLEFGSGVMFDNRLLMTASPGIVQNHGVFHRALAVLDFDLITSMRSEAPPAWEGIWTGLNILKVLTVEHLGVERCFIFHLNTNNEIELWELTKDARFDNDGQDRRIVWSIESRAMDFSDAGDIKQLEGGDIFFDRLAGEVDFDMDFRPDGYPCWVDWDNWNECSKYQLCEDEFGNCPTLPNYKEQYRPKRQLKTPPDTFNGQTSEKFRTFYELQTRMTISGFARLKQHRYRASLMQDQPAGKQL